VKAEWVIKRSPRHLLFKAFSVPINIDVAIEWEGRRGGVIEGVGGE